MAFQADLDATYEGLTKNAPEPIFNIIKASTQGHIESFNNDLAIKVGDKLPDVKLSDATGKEVFTSSLYADGPALITFYRGSWCPFCNIALKGFQDRLSEFTSKGVKFVAITPELPDTSLSTSEKLDLKFPVLSDVGNKFAGEMGILYRMPKPMETVFGAFQIDLKERNGDDSLVLPIPATLLVDGKGIVRNTFIDPNYVNRCDPAVAMEWVDAL